MCGRVEAAEFWRHGLGYKRMVLQAFQDHMKTESRERVRCISQVFSQMHLGIGILVQEVCRQVLPGSTVREWHSETGEGGQLLPISELNG